MDAGIALLNGILDLDFFVQPVAGIFDLIVVGDSGNILGDFDDVLFHGLTASTLVDYGIVREQGRQIYRLGIGTCDPIEYPTDTPIPATYALFGLGLFGLGLSRREKRQG